MINLFKVGTACTFADLPGYGFAKVPDEVRRSWKSMIEGYLGNRSQLKLVVLLVDIRRDPVRLDGDLLEGLRAAEIPFLVVATKSDKLKKQQKAKYLSAIRKEFRLPPNQPIPFSSVNGAGRDQVWDEIEAAANKG